MTFLFQIFTNDSDISVVNKNLLTAFIISCSLLTVILPQTGQSQTLNEYATVDSLRVGDTFDFSITLNKNRKYDEIIYPDSSHFNPTFEIRSREQFKLTEYKDSIYYKIQFFGTVDTLIPKLPVQLVQNQDTTTLYTKPVAIGFSSLISENDTALRPLKPIFEFARAWWPYLLALIIIAAIGYYLYRYYLQKQSDKKVEEERPEFTPEPFVNPLKEFRKSIQKLENAKLETQEDYKAFYIDLGDAIRQYYELLYNIPALESTSRELLNMLNNGGIDKDLRADTRAVLQEADMVKFANFNPTQKQAERALKKAYDFLKRAREIDGPRIDHLRRKHQSNMEAKRKQFYEVHSKDEEVQV